MMPPVKSHCRNRAVACRVTLSLNVKAHGHVTLTRGSGQAGATIAYRPGVKRATLDGSIMQALLAPDGTER
jgi:hypothetical protein